MKGTIQIAKFANIPVLLHWSFGLILAWVAYVSFTESGDWELALWGISFVLSLFTCVVMHEYGHALMARRFGVQTRDIILSPIGGIARLEHLPEKPMQEFYIAIAGPLVNIAIATILSPYFLWDVGSFESIIGFFTGNPDEMESVTSPFQFFIPALIGMNLILATFNMLPAFPMDGGRVLRSLLAIRLGRTKATRVASLLGQILAIGLLVWGVYNFQFVTALIGVFVFFTASNEYKMVKNDDILKRHTVGDILRQHFTKIPAHAIMNFPITELQKGTEQSFLVFNEHERIEGVLHQEFILEAIKEKAHQEAVYNYVSPRFEYISPNETLKSIYYKIQGKGYSILPVLEQGNIVGVIDRQGLNRFLTIQSKIK